MTTLLLSLCLAVCGQMVDSTQGIEITLPNGTVINMQCDKCECEPCPNMENYITIRYPHAIRDHACIYHPYRPFSPRWCMRGPGRIYLDVLCSAWDFDDDRDVDLQDYALWETGKRGG